MPYLVRDTTSTLIIRYCPDLADAESHANRLNKIYHPETGVEPTESTTPTVPAVNADRESEEQFTLF